MIPSPCIKLCVLDPARGLCAGCLRTMDEIAAWPTMSEAQKATLLMELARRESDQGPPDPEPSDHQASPRTTSTGASKP